MVELFTSEGCSSCPPADKILSELTQKAREQNLKIYTLGFHVDYWNYLGWDDPFSQHEFSVRQKHYAEKLNTNIYTPQMIINGTYSMGGYDKKQTQGTIDKLLTLPSSCVIHLKINQNVDYGVAAVEYEVLNAPTDSTLHIAVVERNLKSPVLRGENAGQTLFHNNTVRLFQSVQLKDSKGSIYLAQPRLNAPLWNRKNSSIVAFVQDVNQKIVGAVVVDLNEQIKK